MSQKLLPLCKLCQRKMMTLKLITYTRVCPGIQLFFLRLCVLKLRDDRLRADCMIIEIKNKPNELRTSSTLKMINLRHPRCTGASMLKSNFDRAPQGDSEQTDDTHSNYFNLISMDSGRILNTYVYAGFADSRIHAAAILHRVPCAHGALVGPSGPGPT